MAALTTFRSSSPIWQYRASVDPHRPGNELAYHPGETNLRMADGRDQLKWIADHKRRYWCSAMYARSTQMRR